MIQTLQARNFIIFFKSTSFDTTQRIIISDGVELSVRDDDTLRRSKTSRFKKYI